MHIGTPTFCHRSLRAFVALLIDHMYTTFHRARARFCFWSFGVQDFKGQHAWANETIKKLDMFHR
jgi:hypothetical protein